MFKMTRLKAVFKFLLLLILHLAAIEAVLYAFRPIGEWYFRSRPLWGVDFFLTASLAGVLSDNFTLLPYKFWNYGWFGGWPQFTYPFLTVYITALLSRFWDLVVSTQIVAIVFSVLFALGCYFLFFRISKNIVVAGVLAVFAVLSGGVYQTLTWAGSIPSYSAQAAFPWSLGFLVWFKDSSNLRHLLAAALIAGISIFIHPLVFMTYIVPAVIILIFTNFEKGLAILSKIKQFTIFVLIVLVIGLPQFYTSLDFAIKSAVKPNALKESLSTTRVPTQLDLDVAQFNRDQVKRAFTDNHQAPFYFLGVLAALFLATLVASRRLSSLLAILPYLLLGAYFSFYIWIFGQGISIYHGGWYRVFWSVPVWIGALTASFWSGSFQNLHKVVQAQVLRIIFLVGSSLLVLSMGVILFYKMPPPVTIWALIYRSQTSSAHPDVLNYRISDKTRSQLKDSLVPAWFDPDETNWRMYDPDQTVNLWWNSLYKSPLARGYLDPPIADEKRGYIFWLDAALSSTDGEPQLAKVFGYPFETAVSNALFLIDWNAVRYYEGGHVGGTSSPIVPAYLAKEIVARDEIVDLAPLKYTSKHRTMGYFEFKEEIISPILSATNASTIGIFASESGYETVIHAIAERDNINSQRLIPVNLGRFVDDYKISDLKNFNSLYLYDYDYKNEGRAFKLLSEYLATGGKIFVETGVEVKQSTGELADFFPVKKVERRGLGREWALEEGNHPYVGDIELDKFAPPIFDETEWKQSFAEADDVRAGAQVVLTNHGKVVMATREVGGGEVIWSGLNFAYHITRNHNQEEAKMFVNILSSTNDISAKAPPRYNVNFVNANKREIETQNVQGILFKEAAYAGWQANENGKHLRIYKAGPAYPGYMYIPISGDGESKVVLTFEGSFTHKIQILISFSLTILIFEEVAFRGLILGRLRRLLWLLSRRRVGGWWEKEEE